MANSLGFADYSWSVSFRFTMLYDWFSVQVFSAQWLSPWRQYRPLNREKNPLLRIVVCGFYVLRKWNKTKQKQALLPSKFFLLTNKFETQRSTGAFTKRIPWYTGVRSIVFRRDAGDVIGPGCWVGHKDACVINSVFADRWPGKRWTRDNNRHVE